MVPALSIGNLATYSLQIAIIAAGAGIAIRLATFASPRLRLACLRILLLACLALPFVAPLERPSDRAEGGSGRVSAVASVPVAVKSPAGRANGTGDLNVVVNGTPSTPGVVARNLGLVVVVVLASGVAARLLWLAMGLVALRRLRRTGLKPCATTTLDNEAKPCATTSTEGVVAQDFSPASPAIDRAIDLVGARAQFLVCDAVQHPVTFGTLKPVVLLPDSFASLDATEQVAIACHELLHVRRLDWLHTLAEEMIRAAFWFHPAVWWLLGQVDLSREQVIDQAVVALTEHRQPYLNALVRLARVPAGPILRHASLLLGRAHLLQRVALLSREVRMSRWRLAVSLGLVVAVAVAGGRLVVRAFPLVQQPSVASQAPAPAPVPATAVGAARAAIAAVDAARAAAAPSPAGTPAPAVTSPQSVTSFPPKVLLRVEPAVPPTNGAADADRTVIMKMTVGAAGAIEGPFEIDANLDRNVRLAAADRATVRRLLDGYRDAAVQALDPNGWSAAFDSTACMRAAFEAAEMWRFEPAAAPIETAIGFNFARGPQSGPAAEPVRVGGAIKSPTRIRDVKPVYPADAQFKGTQGVVILELMIDQAGIPISAYAVRPIEGLTEAAIEAALQWRFVPRSETPRLLMTVTINFTLGGGVAGGIGGGVAGGVRGGVEGGVRGGVVGTLPPVTRETPSNWPSNAIRVGGNIKQPTKTVDARPVYPQIAMSARVQGVVIVDALIGTDGRVADVRILRSIPLLDEAALDAVRQWQFTPTLLNGVPVPVIATLTVNFSLEDPFLDAYQPGPGVTNPMPIREVKPEYDPDALREKIRGPAIVEAVVGTSGKVEGVRLLKSLDPRLDQKALDAAMQWEFKPGLRAGTPIPVAVQIELMFTAR